MKRPVSNQALPSTKSVAEYVRANHFGSHIASTPQYQPLFEDIARYTSSLLAKNANSTGQPEEILPEGPAAKRRKLQNGDASGSGQRLVDLSSDRSLQFYMQDVSFSIPQRKKLTLEISRECRYLRARNQATKEIEFGISMDQIREFGVELRGLP